MYTPVRSGGMLSASIRYGLPIMLAQARPMPIIGNSSNQRSWIAGSRHMPMPAASRHAAWVALGPTRRATGTIANAATKATKL